MDGLLLIELSNKQRLFDSLVLQHHRGKANDHLDLAKH